MRVADTGGRTLDANAFSDSAEALGEAEIGNGRPDIGMRDGMKGGSLFLNGYNGADKAVFSAAGTYSNAETGKVVFNSVSFYRGTIVFDLAEEKNPGKPNSRAFSALQKPPHLKAASARLTGGTPCMREMRISKRPARRLPPHRARGVKPFSTAASRRTESAALAFRMGPRMVLRRRGIPGGNSGEVTGKTVGGNLCRTLPPPLSHARRLLGTALSAGPATAFSAGSRQSVRLPGLPRMAPGNRNPLCGPPHAGRVPF